MSEKLSPLVILSLVLSALILPTTSVEASEPERPNILWIYLEDVNGWFGCYGDDTVPTPNIDALAERGVRFDRFYTTSGVCSATRSANIVGMMQTSFGAHHHRSSRRGDGDWRTGEYFEYSEEGLNYLPDGVRTLPEYFRAAGYYSFNNGRKDDYNFVWESDELYDWNEQVDDFEGVEEGQYWTGRAEGQPFFGQIQTSGGKDDIWLPEEKRVDPESVTVPPYYPDIPLVREEIAKHYDCIRQNDVYVGRIIEALREYDLYDDTVVILMSDHGFRLHRHKQFLYEGGINMPLIIAGPGIPEGEVREDLISGIDIAPTSLARAGLWIPEHMEGRDIFADDLEPRDYVVSARDRLDYTIDHIRAIVTPRFKYIRNFMPERPYMQPSYKDMWDVSKRLREMMANGEMNETQLMFFGDRKPAEELYDLESDPHEIVNLAHDSAYADELARHRRILWKWILETDDQGQYPESDTALMDIFRRWEMDIIVDGEAVFPEFERLRPRFEKERAEDKGDEAN